MCAYFFYTETRTCRGSSQHASYAGRGGGAWGSGSIAAARRTHRHPLTWPPRRWGPGAEAPLRSLRDRQHHSMMAAGQGAGRQARLETLLQRQRPCKDGSAHRKEKDAPSSSEGSASEKLWTLFDHSVRTTSAPRSIRTVLKAGTLYWG